MRTTVLKVIRKPCLSRPLIFTVRGACPQRHNRRSTQVRRKEHTLCQRESKEGLRERTGQWEWGGEKYNTGKNDFWWKLAAVERLARTKDIFQWKEQKGGIAYVLFRTTQWREGGLSRKKPINQNQSLCGRQRWKCRRRTDWIRDVTRCIETIRERKGERR